MVSGFNELYHLPLIYSPLTSHCMKRVFLLSSLGARAKGDPVLDKIIRGVGKSSLPPKIVVAREFAKGGYAHGYRGAE
jgi:hypothetical protein